MNKLKQLASRLRARFAPRQGKSGSSLAFVVTIGAALVIWVMAIMPTMTATGTAAVKLQNSQSDYLDGKSAIEYAKSELLYIVEESVPYTFAVVRDTDASGNTVYDVVEKYYPAGGTDPAYTAIVSSPSTSDLDDVPTDDSVAAICAVKETASYEYTIVITAYSDCEAEQKYSTTYTVSGNLLIYPEAYNQTQALPLSDFVLVDGKLGANQVWKSTIESISDTSFTETLLEWSSDPTDGYADAGKYPAVFKMTAYPWETSDAGLGNNGGSSLTSEFTGTGGILPTAGSSSSTDTGAIWYETTNSGLKVYMYLNGKTDITDKCTVYFNGTAATKSGDYFTLPTATGFYSVVVDSNSNQTYTDGNGNTITVLPMTGLAMTQYDVGVVTSKHTITSAKITSVTSSNNNIEVRLSAEGASGTVYYGYCTSSSGNVSNWQTSDTFTVDAGKTYYFYACVPGSYSYSDSKLSKTETSDVVYAGTVVSLNAASSLTNGSKYLVVGASGNTNNRTHYAMNTETSDTKTPALTSQKLSDSPYNLIYISNNAAAYYTTSTQADLSSLEDLTWTVTKGTGSNSYQISKAIGDKTYYLNLTANYKSGSWSPNLGLVESTSSLNDTYFTISSNYNNSSNYKVYRYFTSGSGRDQKKTNAALEITNSISVATSSSTTQLPNVYFMEIPTVSAAPAASSITPHSGSAVTSYNVDISATYGDSSYIRNLIASNGGPTYNSGYTLYINGTDYGTSNSNSSKVSALNAGTYMLYGKTSGGSYFYIGKLTVNRASLSTPSFSVDKDSKDELLVTVTGTWSSNGGTHYFAYIDEDGNYQIFTSDESSYQFRLPYGTHTLAIMQSGTANYATSDIKQDQIELTATYVKLSPMDKGQFIPYNVDDNGNVTWLGPITVSNYADESNPTAAIINVSRITHVWYRTHDTGWTADYNAVKALVSGTTESIYIGINIMKTNYSYESGNVYQVTAESAGLTTANGYISSMLRGSSLYFMGSTSSIDTKGNTIYLNADLLVLSNPIKNSKSGSETTDYTQGAVYVAPYTDGKDYTLVYFGTDVKDASNNVIFAARNFYEVPANTDLCNVTKATADTWKVGNTAITTNASGVITEVNFADAVEDMFAAKQYPEINLDIAYATSTQLQRIVSGETIGWTSGGVLSGSDSGASITQTNAKYAVCAYVTEINGAVSRTANRVLIAAQEFDSNGVYESDTLTVPNNLSFTTRYLSIETDNIRQGSNGVAFKVHNLGQNQNFITAIINGLYSLLGSEYSTYSSKTLQVDYECPMYILDYNGAGPQIKAQICRYEDVDTDGDGTTEGVEIFTQYQSENLLMVPYTSDELSALYDASALLGFISNTPKYSRIVERYVQFYCPNGDTITFDNSEGILRWNLNMSVYANYLYIDSTVKNIKAYSYQAADIIINTQENGYSEGEYLKLFGSGSTESYSGTLLYICNDITYSYRSNYRDKTVTIESGFYYLPATTDGHSLSVLAKPNSGTNGYHVDEDDIKKYAIYIDESGTISQAYADTGLIVSGGSGVTGFGGGSVG